MRHAIFTDHLSDNEQVVENFSDISLREILPTARFFAADDLRFSKLAESSQSCRDGELVVYRIGEDDPMRLVADALARGAIGILTEQLLPCPLPQCVVGDVEVSLAKIASVRLARPDRKLLTVGVIGSAGKSTTALLVASLMRSSGYRAAYQTSVGDCDGIVQNTSKDGLPSNATLVQWLDEAAETGSQVAIVELSDQDARYGGYDAIELDILIVVGSGRGPTDFGPTGLQCVLDRLTDDGIVIAPAEDAKATRLIRDADATLLTYSVRKAADLTAKIIDQTGGMTTLMVNHRETTTMMETPLCGAANAANHLAAASVGLLLGQPIEEIVENLGKLREIPGRGQRISQSREATIVIDTAGTPERAAASLRTYRSMKGSGRLWCLLAIGNQDSSEQLAEYGTLIERFADNAIVTARSDTKESFMSTSHSLLDGVQECAAMRLVADRRRAIEWAMSEARPADTILFITGETYQTAHEELTDIGQIKNWIEKARESNETEPVKLKIFK